jgi:hypothetical protein
MKKRNLFIYAAFIWVAACSPKPVETEVQTDQRTEEENKYGIKPHYKISYNDAVKLIEGFINQPNLLEIGKNQAIGGTVGKEAIKKSNAINYKGCMAWYCSHTQNLSDFPKFFLAFEDGQYNPENVPDNPSSDSLFYPLDTIKYDFEKVSKNNVELMLNSEKTPWKSDGKIDKKTVEDLIKNIPSDMNGNLYNRYKCSFFENQRVLNMDIEKFLSNPELDAVRYYFGYDEGDDYKKSNRIRIILIGVDKEGKNILPENKEEETYFILQNSWPPPPPKIQTIE